MGHSGSLKREKWKLSTLHSLFNVTVLTGLLHGLLFTAFTITRWGHFCWGKIRQISKSTFDQCNEIVWASYSFRRRGSRWVIFMVILRKKRDEIDATCPCLAALSLDSTLLWFRAEDTTPTLFLLHTDWLPQVYQLFMPGFNSERLDTATMPKRTSSKVGLEQIHPAQTPLSASPFFSDLSDTDREKKNMY